MQTAYNWIQLHWQITNQDVELEFDVTKEFDVEDPKPAFITILDYYENGEPLSLGTYE